MPQSLGIRAYEKQTRMGHKTALQRFAEGRLPSYVGAVQGGPISVREWACRNGVCIETAHRLYRAGKLPQGVVLGGRGRKLTRPFWESPAGKEAIWAELSNCRKLLEGARAQQRVIVSAVHRARHHFAAITSLRRMLRRHRRTLESLSTVNVRHTREFAKLAASLRMSELVLSPREVMSYGRALNPGSALVQRRWAKVRAEKKAAKARAEFEAELNQVNGSNYPNGHAIADGAALATETASTGE